MFKYSFILVTILCSCVLRYEPLEYYVEGYSPNNDSLRTDGYYYRTADSLHLRAWPEAVSEMYFFENGTFNLGSSSENIDSLDRLLCNDNGRYLRYGPIGFYTIENDTIKVEYIFTDPMLSSKAIRSDFKALRTVTGLTIIEVQGRPLKQEWFFHENPCVPDSVENWLTKHRKYRID